MDDNIGTFWAVPQQTNEKGNRGRCCCQAMLNIVALDANLS